MIEPKLFDQLYSICTKNKKFSKEAIDEYYIGSFMLLKWISFAVTNDKYSNIILSFINNMNKNVGVFPDPYTEYLYLYHTFPKLSRVKFEYIKKEKTKAPKDATLMKKVLDFLVETYQCSVADANEYITSGYIDVNQIKKILK